MNFFLRFPYGTVNCQFGSPMEQYIVNFVPLWALFSLLVVGCRVPPWNRYIDIYHTRKKKLQAEKQKSSEKSPLYLRTHTGSLISKSDGRRERRLFPAARIFDSKNEEGARKIAGAR